MKRHLNKIFGLILAVLALFIGFADLALSQDKVYLTIRRKGNCRIVNEEDPGISGYGNIYYLCEEDGEEIIQSDLSKLPIDDIYLMASGKIKILSKNKIEIIEDEYENPGGYSCSMSRVYDVSGMEPILLSTHVFRYNLLGFKPVNPVLYVSLSVAILGAILFTVFDPFRIFAKAKKFSILKPLALAVLVFGFIVLSVSSITFSLGSVCTF
ncbi:hypothetical protein GF357_03635 [Candidatus Dojkabacteria bacterium]|nr:hypothetical protein [Candidatus Dojkabacteria bacterium]